MIASRDMRGWLAATSMIAALAVIAAVHADPRDEPIPMQPIAQAAIATSPAAASDAAATGNTVFNRAADGMFYINGASASAHVRFIVDTGASVTVLTARDATAFGSRLVPTNSDSNLMTVGGSRRVKEARLDGLVVAGRHLPPLRVAIMDSEMDVSLLGQNALSHLGPILFANDRMILR
ncbi:retropepsin-like aspartic protease family protein [Sphingobium sp. CAP-1]|uniref:retropepsin-like aspartic protease family protein n=1 Tax=Sphingobium sp. CAP-1 TaxID=2676077 RepID=UPI0012BB2293|nr:retropepsin-like aspartic protease [Sphingobium sp. CAP-1]QGP78186.1 TIGR02281 family clan AA aspartic protease [Sphingobium sp. CAP-1]